MKSMSCLNSSPLLYLMRNSLQTLILWIIPGLLQISSSSLLCRWSDKAFVYLSDFVIFELEIVRDTQITYEDLVLGGE